MNNSSSTVNKDNGLEFTYNTVPYDSGYVGYVSILNKTGRAIKNLKPTVIFSDLDNKKVTIVGDDSDADQVSPISPPIISSIGPGKYAGLTIYHVGSNRYIKMTATYDFSDDYYSDWTVTLNRSGSAGTYDGSYTMKNTGTKEMESTNADILLFEAGGKPLEEVPLMDEVDLKPGAVYTSSPLSTLAQQLAASGHPEISLYYITPNND